VCGVFVFAGDVWVFGWIETPGFAMCDKICVRVEVLLCRVGMRGWCWPDVCLDFWRRSRGVWTSGCLGSRVVLG